MTPKLQTSLPCLKFPRRLHNTAPKNPHAASLPSDPCPLACPFTLRAFAAPQHSHPTAVSYLPALLMLFLLQGSPLLLSTRPLPIQSFLSPLS